MQASAAALWINTVFAGFDQSITTAVHNLYLWAGDFFTPFFEFISFLGHDGIILVLLSIALMLSGYSPETSGTIVVTGVSVRPCSSASPLGQYSRTASLRCS